ACPVPGSNRSAQNHATKTILKLTSGTMIHQVASDRHRRQSAVRRPTHNAPESGWNGVMGDTISLPHDTLCCSINAIDGDGPGSRRVDAYPDRYSAVMAEISQ
ncbi:MAG: hypothetical protein ACR2PG_10350, partial [Hyphomicrobiaceae bacterium]